jgi:hypothetical protein
VIGTDCIDSCKSNYPTITTTVAPTVNGETTYKKIDRIKRNNLS